MKIHEIYEALAPSVYRPLMKSWDKSRYEKIFKSSPLKKDKNAYRLYIPLANKATAIKPLLNVEAEIKSKGFEIYDYMKGLAINPSNNQQIKIGKLLSLKTRDLFNADTRREGTKKQYMVVISRHPYDIGGMSTDRGWTSCMDFDDNQGYNRYVPADVKAGTLIAYVTTTNDPDLKHPVGRVLMKPFLNKNHPETIVLGVENNVYGTDVDGFLQTVNNWVDSLNASHKLDGIGIFELHPDMYDDGINTTIAVGGSSDIAAFITNGRSPNGGYFNNPTTKEQLAAASYDGYAINLIKNPSDAVQLAAVKQDGVAIQYIKNPSDAVQLAAVKHDGHAIQYIKNPSEQVQLAAVNRYGYAIQYIKDPASDAVQLAAVKRDGDAIRYIKNPSKEVQTAARS